MSKYTYTLRLFDRRGVFDERKIVTKDSHGFTQAVFNIPRYQTADDIRAMFEGHVNVPYPLIRMQVNEHNQFASQLYAKDNITGTTYHHEAKNLGLLPSGPYMLRRQVDPEFLNDISEDIPKDYKYKAIVHAHPPHNGLCAITLDATSLTHKNNAMFDLMVDMRVVSMQLAIYEGKILVYLGNVIHMYGQIMKDFQLPIPSEYVVASKKSVGVETLLIVRRDLPVFGKEL